VRALNLTSYCQPPPDFGVCGYQVLLGFANVRPPPDDGGGKARRYFRVKCLCHQRETARYSLRVVAQQDADGIFFLRDLPFQIRYGSVRGVEYLLRLEHIEFGGDSVAQAQIGELDRIYLCLHRVLRDLELQGELQEREVVRSHITYQGQDNGMGDPRTRSLALGAAGYRRDRSSGPKLPCCSEIERSVPQKTPISIYAKSPRINSGPGNVHRPVCASRELLPDCRG
jgi:hypothetical protein